MPGTVNDCQVTVLCLTLMSGNCSYHIRISLSVHLISNHEPVQVPAVVIDGKAEIMKLFLFAVTTYFLLGHVNGE